MQIGEKIRSLRTAKVMTQKQLAGEQITRNMLSRIENGTAKPSLQTVMYLAGRLNVPPGYLLAKGEDEKLYRKISQIDNIKRALKAGNYTICRDLCLLSEHEGDDEINLILALCCSGIAKEEFNSGALRAAVRSFEEAAEYADKSIYNAGTIRAEAIVYLRFMRRVSQTFEGELAGSQVNEYLSQGDPFCVYVKVLEKLEGNLSIADSMKTAEIDANNLYFSHIMAKMAMGDGDYQGAVKNLLGILTSRGTVPDPFLYSVFYDLELCSKEINDYKGAYEYAAGKINLLEKMLSDTEG